MERIMMEELKTMSREERAAYFKTHKSELLDETLEAVSGGKKGKENPNSSCPYKGNWYTSYGWVCNGVQSC